MPRPVSRPRRALIAAFTVFALIGPAAAQAAEPVVAAAADLQFALAEIAQTYTTETGERVRLTFGSTGNFARQIRAGAPFDIYMAADERFIAALHRDGLTRDAGDLYALGRVVLKAPHGSPLKMDGTLADLAAAVADGRLTKFAIANPEHAPYGMRAEEALKSAGVWEAIQPKLVLGENVAQAAQFALSGGAEGGIIALSLALAPTLAAQGTHVLIPEAMHSPLRQRMVLLKDTPAAARFYAYMNSDSARAVMRRYGFLLPGEVQ